MYWVWSDTAWDIMRALHIVQSAYGVKGGMTILVQINVESIFGTCFFEKKTLIFLPPQLCTRCVFLPGHVMVILVPHWSRRFWTLSMLVTHCLQKNILNFLLKQALNNR